jgi:hypothetical protein
MKRTAGLTALVALWLLSPIVAHAQERLVNGNLDAIVQVGDPALYWPEFVGWTITTDPCSYSPCAISPYVPGAFYTQYSGYPATFANRLVADDPDKHGMTATSFEGYYPFEIIGAVDIEIEQSVSGFAGRLYQFSGWAHFEGGYAGGVRFLDILSPNQRNQDAQAANPGVPVAALTDTFFALEFLDVGGSVLLGSIFYELHDDGGQQNDNELDGRTWIQHTLAAVAPAGTARVQVRAGMIDGEFNIDAPHQRVFFDDFSLTGPLFGDLSENGSLGVEDWQQLRAGQHTNLIGLTPLQAYAKGDLNGDFRNDHADFVLFKEAFDAALGSGAFLAMLNTAPEPSALMHLFIAIASLLLPRRR